MPVTLSDALEAEKKADQGIELVKIDARKIKPMDQKLINPTNKSSSPDNPMPVAVLPKEKIIEEQQNTGSALVVCQNDSAKLEIENIDNTNFWKAKTKSCQSNFPESYSKLYLKFLQKTVFLYFSLQS